MNSVNVKMTLNNGKAIRLELYPDIAPITVDNFVKLIKDRYFDGLCFHRVIDGFMIQGGGFTAEGRAIKNAKPAKSIKGEFASNGINNTLSHVPGVISMARTNVPDSASSQFFICVADCRFLDGQYAAFGKTADAESLENAISLGKTKTHSFMYYDDIPDEPIIIESFTIEE